MYIITLNVTFLGDSAYPLSPWLMKIYDGNNLSVEQQYFNQRVCSLRQIIERCIGLLKIRFRCIMGERKLRYMPTKVGRIVYACATLHNFLIFNHYNILHNINQNMLQNFFNAQNVAPIAQNQHIEQAGRMRRNEVLNVLIA